MQDILLVNIRYQVYQLFFIMTRLLDVLSFINNGNLLNACSSYGTSGQIKWGVFQGQLSQEMEILRLTTFDEASDT